MESKGKSEDFLKGDSAENLQKLQSARVWCPGSFDLYHYGHASLLRRAKESGKNVGVVAGLHSDKDLRRMEGEPVFTEDERYEMLKGVRWVDDIVKNAPTDFNPNMLEDFSCDYAVLGIKRTDRKTRSWIESGYMKLEEKFKGISTGSIIHRILSIENRDENNNTASGKNWNAEVRNKESVGFSTRELLQFSTQAVPKTGDKVVYVAGSFDILHPGHLKILENAAKLGDFLFVGVHSDNTVTEYAGPKYPIMRSDERVMALLSCRYVSEVIMDAPLLISEDMIDEFSINVVAGCTGEFLDMNGKNNPYFYAKKREIYQELDTSGIELTTEKIVERVHAKWFEYEDRLASSSSSDFLCRGEQKSNKSIEVGMEELHLETRPSNTK